jgi:prepilin-type N-terminal cleavage/methylation domain-containing protein
MKKPFVLELWKANMKKTQKAFTIVEVLISIALLSLVLMALYRSADLMRASNLHLFNYLQKANTALKGSRTLYKDLMYADNDILINTEEKFHRLTISNTSHSLYGLAQAKVVWLVYKTDNTLLRIEGGEYNMPLQNEERVEIDVITKNLELFKIYRSKKKDKVLAMIQVVGQDPQVFMIQNIPEASPLSGKKGTKGKNPTGVNNKSPNTQPPNNQGGIFDTPTPK